MNRKREGTLMRTIRAFAMAVGASSAIVAAGASACWSVSWAQSITPRYGVDPTYPKPLPDHWVTGGLGGHCIDAQDHVFLLNRQDVLEGDLNAGRLAPPIIEIDPAGNMVHAWGDLKVLDPRLH